MMAGVFGCTVCRRAYPAQAMIEYIGAMIIGLMTVVSVLSILPDWIETIFIQVLEPAEEVMDTVSVGHSPAGVVGSIPQDSDSE